MLDLAPPKRDESESETESESDNSVVVGQNEKLGNKMVSNSNFRHGAKFSGQMDHSKIHNRLSSALCT